MAFKQSVELVLPDGVTAKESGRILTLAGPKGEVSRAFPSELSIAPAEGKLIMKVVRATKKERRALGSFKAHIRNMMRGVTEGHHYQLKICSGHFPMSVSVSGKEFMVKNFFGEKTPRKIQIPEGVSVKVKGSDIDVESADRELASQTAASMERLTKRTAFDRRVFQDGIYIVSS
jgi:large subunit ribosomal protein L6